MAHALLPDPKAFALDNIAVQEGIITFHIRYGSDSGLSGVWLLL